ncbi:MAG: hypothetical protein GYA21_09315 [Myxococcales bacterium]|nr:hypothetical protein [Myxococcales bacterium]
MSDTEAKQPSSKTELALEFLGELADMPRDRLQHVIRQVVGEELASVMFNYARQVMQASPDKILENASSFLILGYLIRAFERGEIPEDLPTA